MVRKIVFKIAVFCAIVLTAQVALSLQYGNRSDGEPDGAVPLVRIPPFYKPTAQILQIQEHSRAHPQLGFLWKENIGKHEPLELSWDDGETGPLYSDQWGFANTNDAIAELESGRRPDIIGIGASYMGGAQALFYEYFGFRGQFYYSLAHGRFTMPQFNKVMEQYALPLKPTTIVYGLNEVSYLFIDDFNKWAQSGIDWFTYHSGTWCGPEIKSDPFGRFLQRHSRIHGIWTAVRKKVWWGGGLSFGKQDRAVDRAFEYIVEAHRMAREAGVNFVVLYIPSRETAIGGPDAPSRLFDRIGPKLKKAGISIVDPRQGFAEAENPRQLYFVRDDHWNRAGIYIAARVLLEHLEERSGNVAQR